MGNGEEKSEAISIVKRREREKVEGLRGNSRNINFILRKNISQARKLTDANGKQNEIHSLPFLCRLVPLLVS